MRFGVVLTAVGLIASPAASQQWEVYEDTYLSGTISGTIRNGTILRTVTGNTYEIVEPYIDVVVEVMPRVLVLRSANRFRLEVEGFSGPVFCRKLNDDTGATSDSQAQPTLIESRIDGDFEGYEAGNIYRLQNGQIWEQVGATYRYRYRYAPRVMIVLRDSGYYIRVEPLEQWVRVERWR